MIRPESASLPPGFRFHPTDEELVRYYLKRKVLKKPTFDAISVINIYKSEPWDLPNKSKLKTRDLEWYFFSVPDKKYGNGSRTNRATDRGYWKTTGKDRPIHHKERVVGMKKTLVYHKGRPPHGERTNWVMHEYRLTDQTLDKAGIQQDGFVLCRVFQKSGSGPKNGEQYGAPFIEEEWEIDDDMAVLPGQHVVAEVADDAFLELNDIEKNLDIGNQSEDVMLGLNWESLSNSLLDLAEPSMIIAANEIAVEDENLPESVQIVKSVDHNYLLEVPDLDVSDYLPINDGSFLEAIHTESMPFDPDEYLCLYEKEPGQIRLPGVMSMIYQGKRNQEIRMGFLSPSPPHIKILVVAAICTWELYSMK